MNSDCQYSVSLPVACPYVVVGVHAKVGRTRTEEAQQQDGKSGKENPDTCEALKNRFNCWYFVSVTLREVVSIIHIQYGWQIP